MSNNIKVKLNWYAIEEAQKLDLIECAMVDNEKSFGDYPDFKRKENDGQLFLLSPKKEAEFTKWLKTDIDTKISRINKTQKSASPKLDEKVQEIYSSLI